MNRYWSAFDDTSGIILALKAYIMAVNGIKHTSLAKKRTVVSTHAAQIRFKCQGDLFLELLEFILTIVKRENSDFGFFAFSIDPTKGF